jgi:hypothetical protein
MGALDVGRARGAPAQARADAPQPVRRTPWREAATLVAVTRAAVLVVAAAAAWYLADSTGPLKEGFLDIWTRWDARHFAQVAEFGYTDPRTDPHATAFFPLFPLLVRALSVSGIDQIAAGMVVSFGASIVACAYLYRLADEEIGPGAGRRAVLYLLLFPTAVFLTAAYSEALFLAGAIPAFYYARRDRWPLVALPAAVAVATRFAGVFVILGLGVELLTRRRPRRARRHGLLALGAALAPLVAYGVYLAAIKGNPFYFIIDQREGWHREPTNPITSFVRTWETWGSDQPTNWIFAWRVEIVAAIVGLALVGWALKKREWGYATFMGATMAVLLSSTWYFSIPRMLLSFFPAMLFLAEWARGGSQRHELLVASLAAVAGLGVVVFTHGAWFY